MKANHWTTNSREYRELKLLIMQQLIPIEAKIAYRIQKRFTKVKLDLNIQLMK